MLKYTIKLEGKKHAKDIDKHFGSQQKINKSKS